MRYARGLLQEAAVLATPPVSVPSHADAVNQNTTSTAGDATPSSTNPFDVNSRFSPTMIIILVILLSAFAFMGFFAVYVRRCASEESISQRGGSRRTGRQDELIQGSGVDPSLVESYPMVSYVVAKKKGCNECVVCLGDFERGDELKQLPKCKHVFHPACIGSWLESHTTCPLCRRSLVNVDRWSVSFRWGGSSRGGASLSTRLSGEENSRSRRGGETASPWLQRAGSSTGWLQRAGSSTGWLFRAAGRNEDASSQGGAQEETSVHVLVDASSRGGAQEETSVRVLDARASCELETQTSHLSSSSSQHGLAASVPFSEVASSGLPARALSTELQASSVSEHMPREIQECSEGMPRGNQVPLSASGERQLSEVATSEVAQRGQVQSRKPRQAAVLQGWRRLSRSNSTGHSLRRRAALQQAMGCMPFSLHRSRSAGRDEEEGAAWATSEQGGTLSGGRCARHGPPHEPCQGATSDSVATSTEAAKSAPPLLKS